MTWNPDAVGDELNAQFAPLYEAYGTNPELEVYMRAFGRMIQPIDDLAKDNGNTDLLQLTNLIENPSAGVDVSLWTPETDSTVERDLGVARFGEASFKLSRASGTDSLVMKTTTNLFINEGQYLAVRASFRPATIARTISFEVHWFDDDNVWLTESEVSPFFLSGQNPVGQWTTHMFFPLPAPPDTGRVLVRLYIQGTPPGEIHNIDGIAAYVSDAPFSSIPYLDGEEADFNLQDGEIRWTGLPHLSQSEWVIASETNAPGWSQALDVVRAKDKWLRWLGQWVGYYMPLAVADYELERGRIVTRSAHRRGSIDRLREAIQEHLNAPQTVIIQERFAVTGSTAGTITVSIYNSQIKTTAALAEATARAQKAGGLKMTFNVLTGEDWNTLVANQATWNTVTSKFANWIEAQTNPDKP